MFRITLAATTFLTCATLSYTDAHACGMPRRDFRKPQQEIARIEQSDLKLAQERLQAGDAKMALRMARQLRLNTQDPQQLSELNRIAGLAALQLGQDAAAVAFLARAPATAELSLLRAEAMVRMGQTFAAKMLLAQFEATDVPAELRGRWTRVANGQKTQVALRES